MCCVASEQVVYNFQSIYLLQEPLLIVGSFLAFFVLAMAYFRIELSLSDPKLERRAAAAARSIRGGPVGDVLNSQSQPHPLLCLSRAGLIGAARVVCGRRRESASRCAEHSHAPLPRRREECW